MPQPLDNDGDDLDLDEKMMRHALVLAGRAASIGEVPIAAVVAVGDRVIAAAHNLREIRRDPTAHAEMLVIREASRILGRWRLIDATLYVTLEPCAMCAGALVNARVRRLVYGTRDPRAGAIRTLFGVADDTRLNHRLTIAEGVLAKSCADLLTDFFRARRR